MMPRWPFAVKGLPPSAWASIDESAKNAGWNVAKGDLPLPVLTVSSSAIRNNLDVMAQWCRDHECYLAPHGKTTMAPELFGRQLDAGAWGITVATVRQMAVAHAAGAKRIILANQVVGDAELIMLGDVLSEHGVSVMVFVDSFTGLELAAALGERRGVQVPILIELGVAGGRTGVRDEVEMLNLLKKARQIDFIDVAGVSAFEGVLPTLRSESSETRSPIAEDAAIRSFLNEVADSIKKAQAEGLLTRSSIVTAGGSLAFDLVVETLGPLTDSLVLRSGCYITHDHGLYSTLSPLRGGEATELQVGALWPAINLWARVTSAPEPGLVIVGFGKRDANEDAGSPVPLVRVSAEGVRDVVVGWRVDRMWDQHARLRIDSSNATRFDVGDMVIFGVSHPCTALDKWRTIVEIDDGDNVLGVLETFF